MLDLSQQHSYDWMMILFETEDCAPLLEDTFWECSQRVWVIAREKISDIFMLPEDIEDIVLSQENSILTKNEFKKLQSFRLNAEKYWWMELEATLNISDNSILDWLSFHDILVRFVKSDFSDWKMYPKLYLRYFLLIEAEYFQQMWEDLPFSGLAEPLDAVPFSD